MIDDRRHQQSSAAPVGRRRFSGSAVSDDIESDLLAFIEAVHAGAFDRGDTHEDVLAAVVRLNEAEAFWPLNHFTVPVFV
jgi:hypothetical protein